MADTYYPGTDVKVDTESKTIFNPMGSSFNQAAQAGGFASAKEAREAGYNLVDADYQAPAIISSDKAKENVDEAVDTIDKFSQQQETGADSQPKDTTIEDKVNKYMSEDPAAQAVQEANSQIETYLKGYVSELNNLQSTMDETHRSLMEGIKNSYGRRLEQMKTFNQNVLGGKTLRGIRTGRQRYARDINASILSQEEEAGLQRMSALEDEMNQKLLEAQQAKDANDFQLLTQKTNTLKDLYSQKIQLAIDLNTMATNYEKTLMDRAKFNMEMMRFEEEQAQKIGTMLAPTLLETDDEGNFVLPDNERITEMANQYGIDPLVLQTSMRTQMAEMQKMDRESQKEYLETLKLQQEIANYGMSDLQQEYEYAVSNYGYTGTMFDYMQDKETSSLSSYDILKKQLEIQNLQKAGQDFDTFTSSGRTFIKYDDGTVIPFDDLFPPEVDMGAVETAMDKIKTIDNLLTHKGLDEAVGASRFSRGALVQSPIAVLLGSADKKAFIGKVEQLISQETLDTLINLKKAGGTLGALSDQERIMLRNAASAISNYAIEKDGKVVGYNIDEKTFKQELNTLKKLAIKAYKEAAGIKYFSFEELADNVSESELLEKLNSSDFGNTIEEKRNNILQFYNQSDFNQVGGDTNQAVSQIKDFSPVKTAFGQGIATGIEAGSKFWKYGFDLALSGGKGAPIKTPVSGTVVSAKNDGAWGNSVKIKLNDGRIVRLSHLNSINVKEGQKVSPGTLIGGQGNTGKTYGKTGIHLDITVYKPDGTPYSSQEVASMFNTKLS